MGSLMGIKEALQEIVTRKTTEKLERKRFACSNCGNTWIELVGMVVVHKEGDEDLCLLVGIESENCPTCRSRPRRCPECGSKDVYEIKFIKKPSKYHGIKSQQG
jgi:transposase-like protein